MFDLKLFDIFATVAVGFITICLVLYLNFIFRKLVKEDVAFEKRFLIRLKQILKVNYSTTWYAVIATVLVYSVGLIASDLTERLTDSDDNKTTAMGFLNKISLMESEGQLRKEALFNVHGDYSLTQLGRAIFSDSNIVSRGNKLANTNIQLKASTIDSCWNSMKEVIRNPVTQKDSAYLDQFTGFISQVYYDAKNWIYMQADGKDFEPLQELKDLQNRIDLSRSVVLLDVCGLLIFLTIVSIYIGKHIYAWVFTHKRPRFYISFDILIFLVAWVVLKETYHINEMNFLKRAYGYYLTHINEIVNTTAK